MKKTWLSITMALALCFFMNNAAFAEAGKDRLNRCNGVLYTQEDVSTVKFANANIEEFQAQIQLLMTKEAPGAMLLVDVSNLTGSDVFKLQILLEKEREFRTQWMFSVDGNETFLLRVVKI